MHSNKCLSPFAHSPRPVPMSPQLHLRAAGTLCLQFGFLRKLPDPRAVHWQSKQKLHHHRKWLLFHHRTPHRWIRQFPVHHLQRQLPWQHTTAQHVGRRRKPHNPHLTKRTLKRQVTQNIPRLHGPLDKLFHIWPTTQWIKRNGNFGPEAEKPWKLKRINFSSGGVNFWVWSHYQNYHGTCGWNYCNQSCRLFLLCIQMPQKREKRFRAARGEIWHWIFRWVHACKKGQHPRNEIRNMFGVFGGVQAERRNQRNSLQSFFPQDVSGWMVCDEFELSDLPNIFWKGKLDSRGVFKK